VDIRLLQPSVVVRASITTLSLVTRMSTSVCAEIVNEIEWTWIKTAEALDHLLVGPNMVVTIGEDVALRTKGIFSWLEADPIL